MIYEKSLKHQILISVFPFLIEVRFPKKLEASVSLYMGELRLKGYGEGTLYENYSADACIMRGRRIYLNGVHLMIFFYPTVICQEMENLNKSKSLS